MKGEVLLHGKSAQAAIAHVKRSSMSSYTTGARKGEGTILGDLSDVDA